MKEFVPKILETSTEIVKSSANIVKESTFGLIKNISDTNFWKSRLNFNFTNNLENNMQYETENEQNTGNANLQTFPCFYESLHEMCKTSITETQYNKYSMVDIQNTKLKCCRALLRITMLSESSCYGLEVSDINHCKYHIVIRIYVDKKFNCKHELCLSIAKKLYEIILLISVLLECAKHTIADDWLFGMTYLLSLNRDHILDAQEVFVSLPQTELYIQTALYYYSLELYKKLYTNCEKLYLYKPLDLIRNMIVVAQNSEECDIVKALRYWQSLINGEQDTNTEQTKVIDITTLELKEDNTCIYSEETMEETTKLKNEGQEFAKQIDINNPNSNESEDLKKVTTSDIIDTEEWTDDWGDFSDDSTEATIDEQDKIRSERISQEETVILIDHAITKCVTEEDRFKLFQKLLIQINDLEQYQEVKEIVLQWPRFNMPEHITLDNHPILKMMKLITALITKIDTVNFENRILQEYEELIGLLAPNEVL